MATLPRPFSVACLVFTPDFYIIESKRSQSSTRCPEISRRRETCENKNRENCEFVKASESIRVKVDNLALFLSGGELKGGDAG